MYGFHILNKFTQLYRISCELFGYELHRFGTEMYLLEWGSFPSRLLSDMIESLPSRTRAYLVTTWKGKRLPLRADNTTFLWRHKEYWTRSRDVAAEGWRLE